MNIFRPTSPTNQNRWIVKIFNFCVLFRFGWNRGRKQHSMSLKRLQLFLNPGAYSPHIPSQFCCCCPVFCWGVLGNTILFIVIVVLSSKSSSMSTINSWCTDGSGDVEQRTTPIWPRQRLGNHRAIVFRLGEKTCSASIRKQIWQWCDIMISSGNRYRLHFSFIFFYSFFIYKT